MKSRKFRGRRRIYSAVNKNSRADMLYRILIFLMCSTLVVTMMMAVEKRFAPVVESMAESKINHICADAIFSAISDALSDENITYNELVTFSYDENKKISAMQVDTVRINKLKSRVSRSALMAINNVKPQDIEIPLGTVLGNELFLGRGPNIPVKIAPVSIVNVNISEDFLAGGINQVRHRVFVDVTADIDILLPRKNASTTVTSRITVAETVIVGEIPLIYSDTESKQNY